MTGTPDADHLPATGRLLTGPGPLHATLTEELTLALGRVLRAAPDTSALLDVALPGLNDRRVPALLLGPGGADLIDLDGDRPGTLALAARLRELLPGGADLTVTLVTPGADPDAPPLPDTLPLPDVRLVPAGDPDALAGALRASVQSGGPALLDRAALIARLDVRPARLAFLRGRVLSALDGQGVPGVQVWAQAGASELRAVTDPHGHYALSADQGHALEVGFVPPPRYRAPETLRLNPLGPYLSVEDTRLPERTSRLSEDDLRAAMMQAMQARLETQLAGDPQAWTDPARQLDAVTGDLRAQLREAAQDVAARQQQPRPDGAGLAVRVRHAADQLLLAAQAQDLNRDLHALNAPAGEAQQTGEHQLAVQRAIDTLTGVAASRHHERRRPDPLPARTASLHTRLPLPVPETAPVLWTAPVLTGATALPSPPSPDSHSGGDTDFGQEFNLDTGFGQVRESDAGLEPESAGATGTTEDFGPDDGFDPDDGFGPDDGVLLTGVAAPRGPITEVVMADPRPGPVSPPPVHTPAQPAPSPAAPVRAARRLPLPWVAGGLLGVAALTAAALTLGQREAPAQTAAAPTPVEAARTVAAGTATDAATPARPAPRVAATVTPRPIPAPVAPRVTVTGAAPAPAAPAAPAQATAAVQTRTTQPRLAATPPQPARSAPARTPAAQATAPATGTRLTAGQPENTPAPVTPPAAPAAPDADLPFIEPPLPTPKTPGGPAQTDPAPSSDPVEPAPAPDTGGAPPPAADPASIPATPPGTPPAPDTPGN
ncbi:hypothetical protein GCM10017784_02910 [Deinococcus indicus]|uniref:hypothetical protein n=1 Tax=Deinococcus indicus TaxID=223556 RepID=UPI00174D63A4|nr:hypothetical protein [Deinococcus indicus]GHG15699.1 hypothetical protein GCM10017784_02910 [Deinococcus indicus]